MGAPSSNPKSEIPNPKSSSPASTSGGSATGRCCGCWSRSATSSTPAGSTAYNLSAHGPILPIDAPLLALTPISPFRPRRWRGAILGNSAVVTFRTRENEKRPVSAVADNVEFKRITEVIVRENREHRVTLLFDPGTGLEERVLSEQFRY